MGYRYARAFIVEGLLAREGQEIVLSRPTGRKPQVRADWLTRFVAGRRRQERSGWINRHIENYGCGSTASSAAKAGERDRR